MHARRNNLIRLAALGWALWFSGLCVPALAADTALDAARRIPIQNNGRVKSFDAFSRQTVETIAGRERWEKRDAVTVIFEAVASEDRIADLRWVEVPQADLRAALGLESARRHFAYNEIMPSLAKIEALMKSAKAKRDADKGTSAVEKEAESLYIRLVAVKDLMTGDSIRVIPPADENAGWHSPYQTTDEHAPEFKKLVELFSKHQDAKFAERASAWTDWVHQVGGGSDRNTIALEVLYSSLRPFQWSWVCYMAAFLLLSALKKKPFGVPSGVALALVALAFHTIGLALRVLILKRPPVSNMYESMVYMNWAAMVFAVLFALATRSLVYVTAGCAVSALVMIYGNLLPIDSNLEVLVPVLRSNYWLTIHVMTIVSSYGAFGLAMAIGHRQLILELFGKLNKTARAESAHLIYRVIQLGVLLLGIGTVLGGVWANESWGRFWGWDPKETWALITFLAYLVIVHLKFSKKISDHWLAISSILGFFFVLMTWYGVNFVLGRGLHSYGFGAGGMNWILLYLALEIAFLALVFLRTSPKRSA